MRLIQRDGKAANGGALSALNRLIGAREPDEEPAPTAAETARGIGGRYETISDQLDAAAETLQSLQALGGIIDALRKPITEEYDERRAEHAELMGLRRTIAELRERFEDVDATATQLATQVSRLEAAKTEAMSRAELAEQNVKQVAGELEVARVELAGAAARVSQVEVANRDSEQTIRRLEEDASRLRGELDSSEQRRRESDAAASAAAREKILAGEQLGVVHKQLEQAASESARLERSLAESEILLGAERVRSQGLEASVRAAQEEAAKIQQTYESRLEGARMEMSAADSKLERQIAQAAVVENLHSEASSKLNEAITRARLLERKAAEFEIGQSRAEERAKALEEEIAGFRTRFGSLDAARIAAVERSDQLNKMLQAAELAFKRSGERASELRDQMEAAATENRQSRAALEDRVSQLQAEVERERAARAVADGAVESLRKERGRSNGAGVPAAAQTHASAPELVDEG